MQDKALQNRVSELRPSTGIERDSRKAIADSLANVLSDSYVLFVNTQGLHWNVEGPLFYPIHKLTEEQYEDLFGAIDELAERIRTLGFPAPQTFADFRERAVLDDLESGQTVKSTIEALIAGNEKLAERMREAVHVAEEANDVKTADLLTERLGQHEENAWMLRATIAES